MANDKKFVEHAFAAIAPRYDLLNSLLSFGVERLWRKRTVKLLAPKPGDKILDLCAGTLTLSRDILNSVDGEAQVISGDFCYDMLGVGKHRLTEKERKKILPLCADAESIPLLDNRFNGACVAYGIRNLQDAKLGLSEIHRVLTPRARLVILDFLRPRNPLVAPIYRFYLTKLLPWLGGIISGAYPAYKHLADSIQAFMEEETLIQLLKDTGFKNPRVKRQTFGIAGIFVAEK